KNDDVILPDMYVWVRHNVASPTEFVASGEVLSAKWRFDVRRSATNKVDNLFSLPRPVAVSLNASGLIESGAFRASSSTGSRLDELLVFDNTSIAKNKSTSATYYYWNSAWRKVGSGTLDFGNDLAIVPGSGIIIRSGAGASSTTWTNEAGY
ncbi:MAG TPA: TIGR02597 family protein, partial [Verrucomicrobiae bacterium]|nr:TIGR02597 family protein [Verrucomicrobiae bacterium]